MRSEPHRNSHSIHSENDRGSATRRWLRYRRVGRIARIRNSACRPGHIHKIASENHIKEIALRISRRAGCLPLALPCRYPSLRYSRPRASFNPLSFLSLLKGSAPPEIAKCVVARIRKEYLLRLTKHVDFCLRECLKFARHHKRGHCLGHQQ